MSQFRDVFLYSAPQSLIEILHCNKSLCIGPSSLLSYPKYLQAKVLQQQFCILIWFSINRINQSILLTNAQMHICPNVVLCNNFRWVYCGIRVGDYVKKTKLLKQILQFIKVGPIKSLRGIYQKCMTSRSLLNLLLFLENARYSSKRSQKMATLQFGHKYQLSFITNSKHCRLLYVYVNFFIEQNTLFTMFGEFLLTKVRVWRPV